MSAACYLAFPCGFAHTRSVVALSWSFPVSSHRLAGCPFPERVPHHATPHLRAPQKITPWHYASLSHPPSAGALPCVVRTRSPSLLVRRRQSLFQPATFNFDRLGDLRVLAKAGCSLPWPDARASIHSMVAAVAWVQLANEPSYHRDGCV